MLEATETTNAATKDHSMIDWGVITAHTHRGLRPVQAFVTSPSPP
jgi:hypothetical protein